MQIVLSTNNSKIIIRKAKVKDLDQVCALGSGVDEFCVNKHTVDFWPKDTLEYAIKTDDVIILVAEQDGLVGFVIANYNKGFKKAIVENIIVRMDCRGQRIGDSLLKFLLELLEKRGCEYISTLVPIDAKNATALYIANGFTRGESFLWLDKAISDGFKK